MRRSNVLACLVLLLALAGCGSSLEAVEPVEGTQVAVVDNAFEPAVLSAPVGTEVTWVWEGNQPHDVVGEGFGSEVQTEGTFTHTFNQPGRYEYRCTIHPGMKGAVVVGDAS